MLSLLRTATSMLFVMTVLTGVAYPLAITAIAQVAFPHQANGSLLVQGSRVVGSELIGQNFSGPRYFWGRSLRLHPFRIMPQPPVDRTWDL